MLTRAYPVRDFLSIEKQALIGASVREMLLFMAIPLFRTVRQISCSGRTLSVVVTLTAVQEGKRLTINDFRFEGLEGLKC